MLSVRPGWVSWGTHRSGTCHQVLRSLTALDPGDCSARSSEFCELGFAHERSRDRRALGGGTAYSRHAQHRANSEAVVDTRRSARSSWLRYCGIYRSTAEDRRYLRPEEVARSVLSTG